MFKSLKKAIVKRELIDIKLDHEKTIKNMFCIKFMYTDYNWFAVFVDELEMISLYVVSQIVDVSRSSVKQVLNQKKLQHYTKRLRDMQNSNTNPNKKTQTAKLKALPNIAHFFEKNSKKFFKSQKFVRTQRDNSVVWTMEYSSTKEILEFAHRWLPNLMIQEPPSLRQESSKQINKYIANQTYEVS